MPKRNHAPYYYAITDAVVAKMGAEFHRDDFYRLFPAIAREYGVIPHADGYLAHRRIIEKLVSAKMRRVHSASPKAQLRLAI